ncbi:MAG: cell division protein FtsX [Prolixibacteraceae bacterium]|jgi:cell division transport system permease protein|nr:cell division protein FtsX [Prolixibacteraceae bacterium]MBT6007399.1 cell division protein FtsX [Prolixibacteraceae bacterium]MBT6763787.1 cell division protein FtsX [Prolixibacteraceae bacterium]MBT7001044.1 cell division protein FtsX [Prolixibacteraceae bacterium]MBT7393668.1 cell division protein FtsX [Prolixibacteraceae bacterium]
MGGPKPQKLKQRIFSSWVTSTISISLVLIMLGTLALVLINAGRLSDYVREKIGFTLVLHDDIKEVEIIRLQKLINAADHVKSTRYIDKETAAKELTEELGEDFTGFLGFNPLFSSIDVKLFAPYTNTDNLLVIEKEFLEYPQVKEVYYQKNLVSVINQNVSRISIILLIISSLLIFIFVALINNTIRISVYSQRFTINTMQLVGAGKSFIRKPFLQRSLFFGIYGALIANLVLISGVYAYKKELYGIISTSDLKVTSFVFVMVLVMGMSISYLSTYFAVNKFLKMKFDELFY